jgi:hypothetical protein
MADIKFEEAQAKMWIADVKNEIDIVDGILKNVTRAMTEVPGEDDVIYQGIRKIANTVTNVWTNMINGFKKAAEAVDTTIKRTVTAGNEILAEGENVNQKMSR